MKDYFFILEYGQWLILVLSILALYLVSSVKHKTRLKGYLMTALSRFSGAIIFLFVDLFAFVIANLIQTYIAIRGYFQNKKAVEGSSTNSEAIAGETMVCLKVDVPEEMHEIDDELKAIYHGKDSVCIWVFKTREKRNRFMEETAGMNKERREKHFADHYDL